MRRYSQSAVERVMKVQEVILKAMSGEFNWIRAAQIIGISPRSMRRWKYRYEKHGYDGLFDRRTGIPSPKRAPFKEVERILRLYRERYDGFNVCHFHQIAKREHGVVLSYTFVKKALQEAGLVRKKKKRGRHFKRREPRACLGEMLHIDGSPHAWLSLTPEKKQTLIAVLDDATKKLLYAQLWPQETTEAVMTALYETVKEWGIPMTLYTDRASWAFYTPKAGGKVDKERLTQVGRMLARLGVEHIPAYSPQARGRSERLNRTLQDRLINELRVAGIRSVNGANRYLREQFIPQYDEDFTVAPREPQSAFVGCVGTDLAQIFCIEEKRTVGHDNTVVLDNVRLQLEKQVGRASCAGLNVTVRRHLNGEHTVWQGKRMLGEYGPKGKPKSKKKGTGRRGRGNSAPGYALRSVAPSESSAPSM